MDNQAADNYFDSKLFITGYDQVTECANGTFIFGYSEDRETGEQSSFSDPLFDSIDGISPSGTNYRELGSSCHSDTIKSGSNLLLNS